MTTTPPESSDRLDRIEAAQERFQEQIEELRQRQEETQAQLDRQIPVIAELRVAAEALLQTAQIHQRNFEQLIAELNRHRSDGHGA